MHTGPYERSYIGSHDLLVPSKPREIVKERLAHLARGAIAADDVVPVHCGPALGRLDLDPGAGVVLLHGDDLVVPQDLAAVLFEELVVHQLVELVEHEARGAQVLAVDVVEHGAVEPREPVFVVLHAPPRQTADRHSAAAHLVEDPGPLQVRHRGRSVDGGARAVVEGVGRLEQDYRYAVLCQQEAEEQPGWAGADDNDLVSFVRSVAIP